MSCILLESWLCFNCVCNALISFCSWSWSSWILICSASVSAKDASIGCLQRDTSVTEHSGLPSGKCEFKISTRLKPFSRSAVIEEIPFIVFSASSAFPCRLSLELIGVEHGRETEEIKSCGQRLQPNIPLLDNTASV